MLFLVSEMHQTAFLAMNHFSGECTKSERFTTMTYTLCKSLKMICDRRVFWTIYKWKVPHCMQVYWSSGLKCLLRF